MGLVCLLSFNGSEYLLPHLRAQSALGPETWSRVLTPDAF